MTENPYTPPKSDLTPAAYDETAALAGRGQRLAAAILDTLIALVILMPLMILSGYIDRSTTGQTEITEMLLWNIAGFVLFLALHGWLLASRGQTIGKRLIGLVDVLFIFRRDRRCIHDMIAGTKVTRVAPAANEA